MKNFRSPQRPRKNTLIVGKQPIMEALSSGKALERIYMQNTFYGKSVEDILALAAEFKVPVNKVPIEKLNGFNAGEHKGFIAQLSKIHYLEVQQVISFIVEKGEVPLFLILDGITDIRNIGGIGRTAFCTGVHAIIIPDKGVGALNEDAISTSAGALEKIAICRVTSLMKTVDELHLNGIKVYASEMTSDKNLYDIDLKEPVAIIMGSEEKGIYPALLKQADDSFKIPMKGGFESLNVSVAAGMILYETMKQRS